MTGKNKCKILKEIRRQIAADHDIAFVTEDCKYQGECTGTCPKCEAEVRYLERELAKRQQAGKAIAVAGIATTILVSTAGCLPSQTAGSPLPTPSSSQQEVVDGEMLPPTMMGEAPTTTQDIPGGIPIEPPMGAVPVETEPTDGELMGEPMPEPTETQPTQTQPTTLPPLMGDPVWVPEE